MSDLPDRGRRTIRPEGLGLALIGALAAWAAGCSWMPMYASPLRYLVPGAILALLIALAGWAGRIRGTHPVVVAGVQVAGSYAVMALWFSPTPGHRRLEDLRSLAGALAHGADQINTYASPAPARFTDIAVFLCACLALLALGIDLVAGTLRRAPLAGLLLLLAVTVPISVMVQRLPIWVFVLAGAAYLALLAVAHSRDLRTWGRSVTARTTAPGPRAAPAAVIGTGCLAAAVLASGLAPVSTGIFDKAEGSGHGDGTRGITLANPLIDLRRDLVQMSHTPLMSARTNDPDPSYVQLSVLDDFTGDQWRASERRLPEGNKLPGALPPAPGVGLGNAGVKTQWSITLAPGFKTSWLPVPTPATEVDVPGDWRYDARTLDVVDAASNPVSGGLRYRVDAVHQKPDPVKLNAAGPPVGDQVDGMTSLPKDLPPVIARTALRVTRGTDTDYQRLARLQSWFRSTGGFRYSTEPAPGSGMSLLAAFVTRDKVGYCEQFAAAMAVMGRTLGIPSRVVVGFLRPTGKAAAKGSVEFTSDDLHAWPQFYFSGSGWVTFDPTPGTRTGPAPAYTQQRIGPEQTRPTRTASPRATRAAQPEKPRTLPRDGASATDSGGGHGLWWLLLIPGLALLVLTPRTLRGRQRQRRLAVTGGRTAAAAAVGCWAEIRATSNDLGLGWEDGRSPRQTFSVLRMRVGNDPELASDLDWLRDFIEHAWYAPTGPADPEGARRARDIVLRWRTAMRGVVTEPAARRERWLPGSLFERTAPPTTSPSGDVGVDPELSRR